jgi:hypothetical protein
MILKDLVYLVWDPTDEVTIEGIQRLVTHKKHDKHYRQVFVWFDTFLVSINIRKTTFICVYLLKNGNIQLYLDRGTIDEIGDKELDGYHTCTHTKSSRNSFL